jgi:hypothetical protein
VRIENRLLFLAHPMRNSRGSEFEREVSTSAAEGVQLLEES